MKSVTFKNYTVEHLEHMDEKKKVLELAPPVTVTEYIRLTNTDTGESNVYRVKSNTDRVTRLQKTQLQVSSGAYRLLRNIHNAKPEKAAFHKDVYAMLGTIMETVKPIKI